MDGDQEKHNAGDRINQGIDLYQKARLLNALSKGRLGKGILRAARAASSAARGVGALVGTSEVWGPIAIALIIILVPTFLIVLGGQGQASEIQSSTSDEVSINTTKTNLNVRFYCQYDTGWTSSCDIIHYGCDPTSLAMIFTSFGDTRWTPSYTAMDNNYMGCFQGTTESQTLGAINKMAPLGYVKGSNLATKNNFNLSLAKEYIDNGYLIHAAANVFYRGGGALNNPVLSNGIHSFVITGVDPIGRTVIILDPTYCTSDTNFVTKTMNVQNDILFNNKGAGWFWAYPIKKVANTQ